MQTVLITGISKGIGKALAHKFLQEGFRVIGTSPDEKVDISHENLKILQLDLNSPASIEDCAKKATDLGTGIDILINNAGVMVDEGNTHVTTSNLRRTLDINLIGTIDFTERISPIIARGGHIVNITSAAGSLTDGKFDANLSEASHSLYKVSRSATNPYLFPSYKISKCALNMYTRILAQLMTHEERDVTVSAVTPGWTKTDLGGADAPTMPEEAAEHIYKLAVSRPETGQFWFQGKKWPW